MTIGTRIFTWLKGELAGTDAFGNRYYRERHRRRLKLGGGRDSRERRWVIYHGDEDASRVPPMWHAWLHHTTDQLPANGGKPLYPWQKPHEPNLTGTPAAYRPSGSVLKRGPRARATGDYEPWTPE
ncbi:MAG: NADH:ubiquinone oxidoreductase subunit NDUFA12 [Alphaproteobacteria bacterium]|nr:NADH:ubiquinone oxidoreductase subunit NDUFA12 [Alphaproteobacteria bacterium]